MKRFLIFFIFGLFFIEVIQAQSQWYRATEFAVKIKDTGESWSEWQSVKIRIKFDLSNDIITIYSNEIQIYKILDQLVSPYDPNGKQVKYKIIDQDYDIGYLRLRVENSGNTQIYIDYSDISWVYNIVKVN